MTNNYFATALVGTDSVALTIRAEDIGTAFELAENCLRERYPRSEVIVQAVQCIFNELGSNFNARDHTTQTGRERTIIEKVVLRPGINRP